MKGFAYVTMAGHVYVAEHVCQETNSVRYGVSYKAKAAEQAAYQGKVYGNVEKPSWLNIGNVICGNTTNDLNMVVGVEPFLKRFLPHSMQLEYITYFVKHNEEIALVAINKMYENLPVVYITGTSIQDLIFQYIIEHHKSFLEERLPEKNAKKKAEWVEKYVVRLPHIRIEEII
jgi:hypothetical protein